MARTGRPRKTIDWDTVEKHCALACIGEEIAAFAGVSYDTLNRACKREKKVSFADYYKKHSAAGNMSLRRAQFILATRELNPTMLIWLGKQWLGQREPRTDNPIDADVIAIALSDLKLPV